MARGAPSVTPSPRGGSVHYYGAARGARDPAPPTKGTRATANTHRPGGDAGPRASGRVAGHEYRHLPPVHAAYRVVPARAASGPQAKVTIPIPSG